MSLKWHKSEYWCLIYIQNFPQCDKTGYGSGQRSVKVKRYMYNPQDDKVQSMQSSKFQSTIFCTFFKLHYLL